MGSSGSGMFGTYHGDGVGSIVNGGNTGEDGCPLEIEVDNFPLVGELNKVKN